MKDDCAKRKGKEDGQALLVVEPAKGAAVAGLVVGQEGKARTRRSSGKKHDPPFHVVKEVGKHHKN